MARDEGQQPTGESIEPGEEPTAIATAPTSRGDGPAARDRDSLWSDGEPVGDVSASAATQQADADADAAADEADAAAGPDAASPAASMTPDGDEARRQVDAALANVAAAKGRASDMKEKAGSKAGEARQRVGAFAAGARDRAAGADVKELAASTTSLIDTARPFFLAFFAGLFTLLGFLEGDSGTSQLFVVGAILFVLAAGFSDELGRLGARRRRDSDDERPARPRRRRDSDD